MIRLRELRETIGRGEEDQTTTPERGIWTHSGFTQAVSDFFQATRAGHSYHLLPDLKSSDHEL